MFLLLLLACTVMAAMIGYVFWLLIRAYYEIQPEPVKASARKFLRYVLIWILSLIAVLLLCIWIG